MVIFHIIYSRFNESYSKPAGTLGYKVFSGKVDVFVTRTFIPPKAVIDGKTTESGLAFNLTYYLFTLGFMNVS